MGLRARLFWEGGRACNGVRHCILALVIAVSIAVPNVSAGQTLATIINPANGAANVDPGAPFTWNPASSAQGYYIWIGTSKGTKNVYESGALSSSITSLNVSNLQVNTSYYLRLWTELNGCWCASNSVDTTFTTGYGTAHLTYPLNAASNTDQFAPFTWNSVPTAQSYTLQIGSTAGGSDIFSSGPLAATSTSVANLQANTSYFATLITQFANGSLSAATTFTTGTGLAHLIAPANGATNVDPGSLFRWNSVSDAQLYYMYIGTSVGAIDVWNSGNLSTTSTTVPGLTAGNLYYARMWTKKAGVWYHMDTTFTTGFGTAHLTYPVNAATNVDPWATFGWTAVVNSQSYTLWIGSSVGASDVYNSGPLNVTSQNIPGLNQNTQYFARLFTNTSGGSTFVDTTFTTGLGMAHLISPAANASGVDPFQPFSWNGVPGAQVYFIYVGSKAGATDVYYSGNILPAVTSQVIPGLLGGQTYYVKLWTFINNTWYAVNTVFSTAIQPPPPDPNAFRNTVQQLNGSVRLMTQGATNTPIPGTALAAEVASRGKTTAVCTDFARTLEQLLIAQRISVRETVMTFDGTSTESHDTTEYFDPFLNKWITADATFGVVYWNSTTTSGLSISDISAAVATQNWSGVQPYVLYTTGNGELYSHNYYMDPILLYLNPLPNGQSTMNPLPNAPGGYMTVHANAGQAGNWLFSFANPSDTNTVIDPVKGQLILGPVQGTIYSQAVNLSTGWSLSSSPSGMQILSINRYLYF